MNADQPVPLTGPLLPPLPAATTRMEPPVRLGRLLPGLALVVAIFDGCFWGVRGAGFSVAVFFLLLAGIILANRESSPGRRTVRWLLGLLAGAAWASALEVGTCNIFVLLALIVALAGETFFQETESVWGRWLAQVVALVRAPRRVFWLNGVVLDAAFNSGLGGLKGLAGGVLLTLPALVLALVFGSLLATGNAVFGVWSDNFFVWLGKMLSLYLNVGRITLWLLVAFVALPLLRPVQVSAWWWSWTQRLPRLPEIVPSQAAFLSSGLVLVVLNLLFLVANLADALFLWSGRKLPGGVSYSGFVHEGTNALTVTAILSAFVLTTIFQQELKVARRRELKLLGLFWIGQNLFLLVSVAQRLRLYIEAYDMTVTRLSVMIFLVLVATGYVLLTIKIVQDRSLSWLIGGGVLAVFATFYVTQFLNLGGWSANYNVARWEKNRSRSLDTGYLYYLGPEAWPALAQAHQIDRAIPILNADRNLGRINTGSVDLAQWDVTHWREFSLRAWLDRGALDEGQ